MCRLLIHAHRAIGSIQWFHSTTQQIGLKRVISLLFVTPLLHIQIHSLSDELRNPDLHSDNFRRNYVSVSTIPGALSAVEALCDYALHKSTFTLHYITLPCTDLDVLDPNSISDQGHQVHHIRLS